MFIEHVSISKHSHYSIGGIGRYFFEAKSVREVTEAVHEARRLNTPVFILGQGTNVLFSDEGWNGLLLKINLRNISQNGLALSVGAGTPMETLLKFAADHNLSGLEWAGGLPGTVGGAIRGNAGAFGGEIKDVVSGVTALRISGKKPALKNFSPRECSFSYRNSVFKRGKGSLIIVGAELSLARGRKNNIWKSIKEKMDYRRSRHPLEYPNIGSIFKNVELKLIPKKVRPRVQGVVKTDPFPVVPAAFLLSEANLKGISSGGAMISPKHPNFIVNVLKASSHDVENLISLAKSKTYDVFKIKLEEEIEKLYNGN